MADDAGVHWSERSVTVASGRTYPLSRAGLPGETGLVQRYRRPAPGSSGKTVSDFSEPHSGDLSIFVAEVNQGRRGENCSRSSGWINENLPTDLHTSGTFPEKMRTSGIVVDRRVARGVTFGRPTSIPRQEESPHETSRNPGYVVPFLGSRE